MKSNYSPLYFLTSLWSWWLAISFFIYLMFMTPHETPIATFDSVYPIFMNWDIWIKLLIWIAYFWVTVFTIFHFYFLIWNVKKYLEFRKWDSFKTFRKSPKEVSLMAIPLTFAMMMNVWFVAMVLFIPWFWNIIEYMFPAAIIWFLLIWYFALKIFWDYFTRIILEWDSNFDDNNNSLSQMIAIFAFSMVWVWLASPAAMSHIAETSATALFFSLFFITVSVFLVFIKMSLWFKSIFQKWLSKEAAPSMWLIIPILTLIWIAIVRQKHAFAHWFEIEMTSWSLFIITTVIISLQILFGYLWYKIMKKNSYFKEFVSWKEVSPWSYSLICPWVAFFVFWMFFIHLGLVNTSVITMFWPVYFILIAILFLVQVKTIHVMFQLNRKHF